MDWKIALGFLSLGFTGGCVFSALFFNTIKEHVSTEVAKLAEYLKPASK